MKGTKDDTAHEDVSTVLSTLKMLSAEVNILVHTPPRKITSFLVALFFDRIIIYTAGTDYG